MKLEGLIRQAYEKAGKEPPEKPQRKGRRGKGKGHAKHLQHKKPQPQAENVRPPPKKAEAVESSQPAKTVTVTANGTRITRWSAPEPAPKPVRVTKQTSVPEPQQDAVEPWLTIRASADARVTWHTLRAAKPAPIETWPRSGHEVHMGNSSDEKHLYLGLDFGTSSLKAVISDRERQLTYAVPFRDIQGVARYLLPCRVYRGTTDAGAESYNLDGHGVAFQDLKLALLSAPDSHEAQLNVVGFLALALRLIRGWLLSTHGATYGGEIIWDMAVGLPFANRENEKLVSLYKTLSTAAWIASTKEQLTPAVVLQAIKRAEELSAGAPVDSSVEEVEDIVVDVHPEIAAQIHGFVSSGAYDPNASNIYLLVDVGAGTLDASVFRVSREAGQSKDSFNFFTTSVEPHGVMNLHRQRTGALQKALADQLPDRADLLQSVKGISQLTDAEKALPEDIAGYFQGVDVQFHGETIDRQFYRQVKRQVVQDTYVSVLDKKLLGPQQMRGMPMFVCGGGSRSGFYQQLKTDMQSSLGCSWFGVTPKPLQRPRGLQAPGLPRSDYHRLSVAYGLSRLKLGEVVAQVPALDVEDRRKDFSECYIEK
ncbi:hypothetical protein LL270_01550 [Pseudomonas aestusnigri]|uniref:hypothetical protein n=1 Tax=Halopseudomonas aestusnigri TaxID=857252 RepID=UPI001D18D43B|nr:hypothetical protein [Halopseudomonas aestusnigri]MCC4259336.1 hypothetical protein [Halopseudomonas aestusnigri]